MPYNGFGTFTLPAGNPVVTGTTISSTINNNTNNDLANGLTNAITRNGQSPPTTNLPMGNFKLTGLTAGTTSGDSVRYDEFLIVASLIPSGTRMPFAQAAAPTGWTQDTTDNATNRMLRVVAGTGNGIGGSASPILNNTVPSHTHGFTTGGQSADHIHYDGGHAHAPASPATFFYTDNAGTAFQGGPAGFGGVFYTAAGYAQLGYQNADHNHSGSTDNGSSQTNWAPRYIDMIICAKN